ncbi:MAG TPA: NADPH-dependent F420 reductase [Candidatus Dormibacteraeota bacterium]
MNRSGLAGVGIIGGTGPMGRGLATRLGQAGMPVLLGSRDPARAEAAASAIRDQTQAGLRIQGGSNAEAAAYGELSLLTIPYEPDSPVVTQLAELLQGRVLVSTAAPMEFRGGRPFPVRPEAGSAAEEVARLCPGALVVGAFHTVSAPLLARLDTPLDEDVVVTSDHPAAKALVLRLVEEMAGLDPVDGGPLENAGYSEGLTPFLIRLNRLHHTNTGVRITGLTRP